MRAIRLALILLSLALLLGGCRFAAVETAPVRVEVPTPTPGQERGSGTVTKN